MNPIGNVITQLIIFQLATSFQFIPRYTYIEWIKLEIFTENAQYIYRV